MQPSEKLINLITRSEGFSSTPYMDQGSLAIGYGHHGPEVKAGLKWTPLDAQTALMDDLEEFGKQVEHLVKVPLTHGQYDALVDFVYNLGAGRLQNSTLLSLLNQKAYAGAGQQLLKWDDVAGKPNTNLLARRQQELQLWNGE